MTTINSVVSNFNKHLFCLMTILLLFNIFSYAGAAVIDPEKHILKNGYHSVRTDDNGKTKIYSFTERANSLRISAVEADIAALPKDVEVFKVCDFMRGGVKANLIQQRGIDVDVAVTNYGYNGATVACTLKYMHKNNVGTQLIFFKQGRSGLYMVIITD